MIVEHKYIVVDYQNVFLRVDNVVLSNLKRIFCFNGRHLPDVIMTISCRIHGRTQRAGMGAGGPHHHGKSQVAIGWYGPPREDSDPLVSRGFRTFWIHPFYYSQPIYTEWTYPSLLIGQVRFYSIWNLEANNLGLGQTPHFAASDVDLQCLLSVIKVERPAYMLLVVIYVCPRVLGG